MRTKRIDQLAAALADELERYEQRVTDELKKEIKETAKECRKEIKSTAPKDTGAYRKAWSVKTAYESSSDLRMIVHTGKQYRLTHLLEHGHAKVGGGRVEGRPHIGPAEQHAAERLKRKAKVIVKG